MNAYVVPDTVFNKLKFIEFASDGTPALIVLVTPVPVVTHSTNDVPDIVKFDSAPVFQIVLVVALVNRIFPVPKFIVLVLPLLLENNPVDSVKVESANVPAVSVNVLVEPIVKLFRKLRVPPTLFTVNGKSSVRCTFILTAIPATIFVTLAPAVNVPPDAGTVKLP